MPDTRLETSQNANYPQVSGIYIFCAGSIIGYGGRLVLATRARRRMVAVKTRGPARAATKYRWAGVLHATDAICRMICHRCNIPDRRGLCDMRYAICNMPDDMHGLCDVRYAICRMICMVYAMCDMYYTVWYVLYCMWYSAI